MKSPPVLSYREDVIFFSRHFMGLLQKPLLHLKNLINPYESISLLSLSSSAFHSWIRPCDTPMIPRNQLFLIVIINKLFAVTPFRNSGCSHHLCPSTNEKVTRTEGVDDQRDPEPHGMRIGSNKNSQVILSICCAWLPTE